MRDFLRGAYVRLSAAIGLFIVAGCGQQPVAIVNGQKITRTEFINRVKQAAGKAVLADLIFRRLVEDEFTRSGLQITEEEVAERVAELKSEFPSQEAFAEWLASMGMSEEELVGEVRYQMKLEKLRAKDVKYTEADLKRFFSENRERYDKPLRVTVSQIVVSTRQEADKVYAELKKPGANFGALARQYSIDAMFRAQGGRLPEIPLSRLMPPELQAVVQNMKVGDIAAPVKVEENWYIIKLEDRKPPEKATFDKVRRKVERDYRIVAAKPKETVYRELAQRSVVQVLDPQLAEVQEMFVPRQELPRFGAGEGPKEKAQGGARQPSGQQRPAPSPAGGSAPAKPSQGPPASGQR